MKAHWVHLAFLFAVALGFLSLQLSEVKLGLPLLPLDSFNLLRPGVIDHESDAQTNSNNCEDANGNQYNRQSGIVSSFDNGH